jgi:hypothetical protein
MNNDDTKEFEFTEKDAIDAPVKDIQWHGKELEFNTQIEDKGQGKPIFLRQFDFAIKPGVELPNKEEIAEAYKKFIDGFLWKDGLRRIQELKVVIEKDKFKIFATCQAKTGAVILEKPLTIQDYASSKHLD